MKTKPGSLSVEAIDLSRKLMLSLLHDATVCHNSETASTHLATAKESG